MNKLPLPKQYKEFKYLKNDKDTMLFENKTTGEIIRVIASVGTFDAAAARDTSLLAFLRYMFNTRNNFMIDAVTLLHVCNIDQNKTIIA